MKTKCDPGDKLKFPNGSEWMFVRYLDDVAIIVPWVASFEDKPRIVCKCCTPKLPELVIEKS
jgi:hypothetical protein